MSLNYNRKSFLRIMGLSAIGMPLSPMVNSSASKSVSIYKNITIYKKTGGYAAFPVLYQVLNGNLYTEFRVRPIDSHSQHIDPRGKVVRMVSYDGGRTWKKTKEKIYNPNFASSSGKLVFAGAYGWRYVDASKREELAAKGFEVRKSPDGHIAYAYGCYKRISTNGGKTWDKTGIKVPSEALIMNFSTPCSYLRLSDNVILRAVYGRPKANIPYYESWLLRSEDNGKSWEFLTIARDLDEKIGFGETALAQAPNGEIIAIMRTEPTRK